MGHIWAVYRIIFNNIITADMETLLDFIGPDKEKIGKIKDEIRTRHGEDINPIAMKQGIIVWRLESGDGLDGLWARLLNHLCKGLSNLVLGAMQEIK